MTTKCKICKKRIAKMKCRRCKKDICENCYSTHGICISCSSELRRL